MTSPDSSKRPHSKEQERREYFSILRRPEIFGFRSRGFRLCRVQGRSRRRQNVGCCHPRREAKYLNDRKVNLQNSLAILETVLEKT